MVSVNMMMSTSAQKSSRLPFRPSKYPLVAVTFLLTILLAAAPSSAEGSGPCLGGRSGHSFAKDVPAFNSDVQLNAGKALGVRFGSAQVEAELAYRHNDSKNLEGPNPAPMSRLLLHDGISAWNLMGNAYYDFQNPSPFMPFIGAGAGAVEVARKGVLSGEQFPPESRKTLFAYQFMAGADWSLTHAISMNLSYLYFSTPESGLNGQGHYDSHNVVLGAKWAF